MDLKIVECSTSTSEGAEAGPNCSLHQKIRSQIAYYFSDANLRHDKFMRRLVNAEPVHHDEYAKDRQTQSGLNPVPLAQFLSFNKISSLTRNEQDLLDAFANTPDFTHLNTQLVFYATAGTIARKDTFNLDVNNKEVSARTMYVEGFDVNDKDQENSIVDFLRDKFAPFGDILGVQTPRSTQSKQLMGFAFIEFGHAGSVERACQQFGWKSKANRNAKSPKLRSLPKRAWYEYKRRYLQLQKEAHLAVPDYKSDPELLKLAANFDSNSTKDEVGPSRDAKRCKDSHIVQLDMLASNFENLNSGKDLQKQLRSLFLDSQCPISRSEVAYIDADTNSLEFQADGSVSQRCFIRTYSAESAQKFTEKQFECIFSKQFKDLLILSNVVILNALQAKQYWHGIKQNITKRSRKD